MSATELTIKGDVEILRLQPGDTIVVTVDRLLTYDQCERIREQVGERFPGHEVLVASGDIRLTVNRKESP